jgi:CyaY protein
VDRLSQAEYDQRAQPELLALRDAFDALEIDGVEADLEGGILTLEFLDDERYVVNSHQAARQIWMAAAREAWHFDWVAERGAWVASRTGDELWETLGRVVANKLNRPVRLQRPG